MTVMCRLVIQKEHIAAFSGQCFHYWCATCRSAIQRESVATKVMWEEKCTVIVHLTGYANMLQHYVIHKLPILFILFTESCGAHRGAVGWVTVLQTRRLWVPFWMVSLEFSIDVILPSALLPTSSNRMSTRNISWGVKVHKVDNLATFMCWLSLNLGASSSWKPQGLSRPL